MTADQIKAVRKRYHFNQAQFWSRIGLSQAAGSRIERGERRIKKPIATLIKLLFIHDNHTVWRTIERAKQP